MARGHLWKICFSDNNIDLTPIALSSFRCAHNRTPSLAQLFATGSLCWKMCEIIVKPLLEYGEFG